MQAAHRDARLILLGVILAWTVGDALAHKWHDVPVGLVILAVFIGMCWPIRIFSTANDASDVTRRT